MIEAVANYNAVWFWLGICIVIVGLVGIIAMRVISHAFSRLVTAKQQSAAVEAKTEATFEHIEQGARPSISRFKL